MTEEIKRTYVIPLRRGARNTPRYKRTNKSVRVLRAFVEKHMKTDKVLIGKVLNELLWENGIKNPPGKVKVDCIKDKEGVVRVELEGINYIDFKQKEKVNKNASFKEKLQSKMTNKKSDVKEDKKSNTKEDSKETKKEAPKKAPAKKTTTKEAPAKKETKAEEKVEGKAEAKEAPKADSKPETKTE